MRCHICDKTLSDKEVNYNNDHQDWEPCGSCLQAISEVFTSDSEEQITKQLDSEWWAVYDGADPEREPALEESP